MACDLRNVCFRALAIALFLFLAFCSLNDINPSCNKATILTFSPVLSSLIRPSFLFFFYLILDFLASFFIWFVHWPGLVRTYWVVIGPFLAVYCSFFSLSLIFAFFNDSMDLSHICSGSCLLPWPLMIFWQGYPKQVIAGHLYQSIIWLIVRGLYKSLGLEELLKKQNQHQTLFILIKDV